MIRCIINADDFGISSAVNEAIACASEKDRITSATILANGPAFDEAARYAVEARISVGLHLNLSEFFPLSRSVHLRPLLNADGTFNARRKNLINRKLQCAIYQEWQIQVDRVRQAIGHVSHVDSHHHVHTLPELMPLLLRFLRQNKIPAVRLSKNLFDKASRPLLHKRILKALWNYSIKVGFKGAVCDYFTDAAGFTENLAILDNSSVEVMVHPGHQDFESVDTLLYHLNKRRVGNLDYISYRQLR